MDTKGNLAYQMEWRDELIDGKVVMMSPRPSSNHNRVAANIFWIFESYLRKKKCKAFPDGYDLFLTEKDRFVPDGMIVCDPDKDKKDGVHGAPDLVVEVLSPSTARNDRSYKKEVYGQCGVREYWLVSPDEKSIEIYRSNGTELTFYDIYTVYADWQLKQMSEEELAAVQTSFKCSLFDDLDIPLEDIFYNTL